MDKPVKDKTIREQFDEAKKLFNAYGREKGKFSGLPGQEMGLSGAMAPFLHSVLDVARSLWASTECETERNLLRQFADELKRIYK